MTQKNRYYVYLHLKKTDSTVFYVGKGTANRAWNFKHRTNPHWQHIYAKHGCDVVIVARDMPEVCALSLERALIRVYGKTLCNLTDGGEGASGYVHTEVGRKKMSEAWVGRVITDEWRANMSRVRKGKPHSAEHVRKQAQAQMGKTYSDETKAKIGAAQKGKTISEAHLAAMSKKIECGNGMSFPSVSAAARWVKDECGFPKANKTNIIYCLKGVTASAYGFTWRYL